MERGVTNSPFSAVFSSGGSKRRRCLPVEVPVCAHIRDLPVSQKFGELFDSQPNLRQNRLEGLRSDLSPGMDRHGHDPPGDRVMQIVMAPADVGLAESRPQKGPYHLRSRNAGELHTDAGSTAGDRTETSTSTGMGRPRTSRVSM